MKLSGSNHFLSENFCVSVIVGKSLNGKNGMYIEMT